jgi:hypothetical protein
MQGYNKCSNGPFILVHYNGLVESCMQGYSKGSNGLFLTVLYIG